MIGLSLLLIGCTYRKERSYDPSLSISYVKKWGPSVRTTLEIMTARKCGVVDAIEANLTKAAAYAARKICIDPSHLYLMSRNSIQSDLFFICPQREPTGDRAWLQWASTIPTEHLVNIFEQERAGITNKNSWQLSRVLAINALLQPSAD